MIKNLLQAIGILKVPSDVSEHPRSPKWPAFEKKCIDKHPYCSACGSKDRSRLLGHHKKPYHVYPELELVESNIGIVCRDPHPCHLVHGHLMSYQSWNERFDEDCCIYLSRVHDRP